MPDNQSAGFLSGSQNGNQSSALEFFFRRAMAQVATATLVKVVAVYSADGIAPAGVVDVQPLVNQIDGQGTIATRPTVYGVPFSRVQSGSDAIIMDPKVGDIGVCCFGDRDLSSVIASQAQAPPGSNRRNSLSDALYVCSILGKAEPAQYIQFSPEGIVIVSPAQLDVTTPASTFNGNVFVNGNLGSSVGVTGSFTTITGQVASFQDGILIGLV
jgi:hypothetical protein